MKKFQRVMALLLVTALLLSTIPLNLYAQEVDKPPSAEFAAGSDQYGSEISADSPEQDKNISDTGDPVISVSAPEALYNPNAKEELIAALAEDHGAETASKMLESMMAMGIIDENGNRLTYKIEMDGEFYTLEQMRDIINSPDADLSKEVKVDGKAVPLELIARVIDFEEYLTFVEENFIKNNVQLSDEHLQALQDLEDQINTEGISLVGEENGILANAEAVNYTPKVTCKVLTPIYDGDGCKTAKIEYSMSYTPGGNETVTFKQTILGGEQYFHPNYQPTKEKEITLTASEPTKVEEIRLSLQEITNVPWSGETALFYIHLNDLRGGLFENGETYQLLSVLLKGFCEFNAYTGENYLKNCESPSGDYGWQITEGSLLSNGYIEGGYEHEAMASQRITLQPDAVNLAKKQGLKIKIFVGYKLTTGNGYYSAYRYRVDDERPEYLINETTTTQSFQDNIYNDCVPEGYDKIKVVLKCDPGNEDNNFPDDLPNYMTAGLYLTDDKPPVVESISSPEGTFIAGEEVPIVVTFSEPIIQDPGGLTLTLKDPLGKEYSIPSENPKLINSKMSFLFKIPKITREKYWPVKISGVIKDPSGNKWAGVLPTNELDTNFAMNDLDSLERFELKDADGNALETAGVYLGGETQGTLDISLFQSDETVGSETLGQKQNNWLLNDTTPDGDKFKVNRLYASYDNGATKIPLYITDAHDKLTTKFDLPVGAGAYTMRLYYDDSGTGQFRTLFEDSYSANFNKGELIPVKAEDITIHYPDSYPSGSDKMLNLGDTGMKLTYKYSGNATYQRPQDFVWVSSDKNIAAIGKSTGEITPVSVGTVTFTLIAMNGAKDGSRDVTKESDQFKVDVSNSPTLALSKFITTQRGQPVQVMWSTNITYLNRQVQKDTIFTAELYEGNYSSLEELAALTPSYTAAITAKADSTESDNSIIIPGEYLTRLSVGSAPAYTVKVSTDNPLEANQKIAALGNITLTSAQASVNIERPGSYYILDTADPLTVNWTSTDVNDSENGCDFEFAVSKNGNPLTTSKETSGSYTIDFGHISGRLKDVYTVTAKIKNAGDEAYSYDSFVLHVYDADAMKIWVDKQDKAAFTMDNEPSIATKTSEEIVAMERNIDLTNDLSINYGDYPYGVVTDQIEWKSSDSSIASINYTRGGYRYYNIENYNLPSYMPNTTFILAGLNDGTATINATHKLSRMTDTLGVEVKTLKDKLYLFQVMPAVKTQFVYTNGDGEKKSVSSDANGAVAIYEPRGIKSDVNLKGTLGGSTYLGTIYNYNLLSGENDGSQGLLYPINNFELRKAAEIDLNFKKPDGTPYTGTVTIRGGVYKNGRHCETSDISDNDNAWHKTSTINPDNGFYRQEYDITRFWSAATGESSADSVAATDKIDYIFELHFGNDDYQPQIIKFSGNLSGSDVVRFGESIVNLVSLKPGEKNNPFFSAQYLDRYKNSSRLDYIKNYTENIGLNPHLPKIGVYTQALWWGRPFEETNSAISVLNEAGTAITGQSYKTFRHPFATMLVTEHQMVIDENNIWVDETGLGKLTIKLFNNDGTLYNSTSAPYSVINMLEVEDIADSPNANEDFEEDIKNNMKATASIDEGDKFIQKALDALSNIKFGDEQCYLIIAPTANPAVFNGLLQIGKGDDIMEGPKDDENFMDFEDEDDIGTTKLAIAKTRKAILDTKDVNDSLEEEAKKAKKGDTSHGKMDWQISGYFACKIYYNSKKGQWEAAMTGGGIRAGGRYKWSKIGNSSVGPIPVTYEIELGAAGRLDLDAHMLYRPVSIEGITCTWDYDYASVTDYLTNLRLMAYIYAFGGLGFDYTVAAVKIGPFGQLQLENQNKFLNRDYVNSQNYLNGQMLGLNGQVGIKFVYKALCFTYRKTLASTDFVDEEWTWNNWDKIEKYWEETTKYDLTPDNIKLAARLYAAETGQDMIEISETPSVESRDYLNDYTRLWGTTGGTRQKSALDTNNLIPKALDIDNLAPDTLQSNAYPYANPLIADDGSIFVYLSDNNSPVVWATTASYAVKQNGSYVDRGTINETEGYGDSGLSFTSRNGQAVSAWVRLRDKLEKNADDKLSNPEIALLTNNTEVYASIYKGGSWIHERLTDNSTPDLAPVVSTNGSKAIVAWRSVYAGDAEDPTEVSAKDTIVYRIYDGNNWSKEARMLYNGVSGTVMGLKAAMLSDGTAAIAYIIDTSKARDTSTYEVVYGVVDNNGEVVNNVRLTNDNTLDENPQLTVTKIKNEERFILGWHMTYEEESDIRLATFGSNGGPREDFIDSLYAVSSPGNIGNNFRFVNTSSDKQDFKNLSVLWTEYDGSTASDSLKAVKFGQETVDGTEVTYASAAIDVARMPDKTVIDSFDAYVADDASDEVKVIILGTESKDEDEKITDDEGNTINVPKTESKMFTATQSYQNKAEITAVDFNYTEILSGFIMPITFTVENQGKELITSATIQYGTESETFNDLRILPGTSKTLVVYYKVPEDIVDLDYSGTATFGGPAIDMTGSGILPLAVPDVGISSIETIKERDGQREFAVTLYNGSDYKLGTSKKIVKFAIYDNAACTAGTEVADVAIISDPRELELMDKGAYVNNLSFDLKSWLGKNEDGTPAEIPDNGITLYARAWVEDISGEEVTEFAGENNIKTIVCPNMVERNGGNPIKVEVQQTNSGSQTTAVLTLQNLAMAPVSNGNVAVNLLDRGGNIIETQYLSKTAQGLANLDSEAVKTKTFMFGTPGADVEAYYFKADEDSMNADLQVFAASGISVDFDKDTVNYNNLKANHLQSTNVTAISANPNAKVSIIDASNTVLTEKTGAVTYTLPLTTGSNTFKVSVKPDSAGAQPKTYAFTVGNAAPASGSVILTPSIPDTRGWWNTYGVNVALTTTGLTDFTPANMQYQVNGGDWMNKAFTGSPMEVTSITQEGTHTINARLQDSTHSNLTANSLTVKVDRTAPVFAAGKPSATLANNRLTVSVNVTDALSGIYSVVMTTNGKAYPMEKQGDTDTDTYAVNITADSIGYILITANDMAGNHACTSIATPPHTGGEDHEDSSDAKKIDLTKTTDSANSIKLSASEVNTAKTLTVNGNGVRLILSEDTLTEMRITSSLEIIIEPVKVEELSKAARLIVGDRPVFNIRILVDGKTMRNVNLYIEILYTPKEGEDTSKLAAFYIADDGTITQMEGSRYDSEKKAVIFTTTHLSMYAVGQASTTVLTKRFTDVAPGSWAESSIYYLAARGIINGKTNTTFAPDDNITRAEFVTILAKMNGNTLPPSTDEFRDVQENAWYAQYVAWASQAGVVKGYAGNFSPNDFIKRQDIAVMLTRYAEMVANYTLPDGSATSIFADDAQIASYARKSVYAMRQAGIISGRDDNTFAPAANASRAEAARMVAVFLQGMSN